MKTFAIKIISLTLLSCFCFSSCKSDNKEQRQKEITSYSDSLLNSPFTFDRNKADTLIGLYNNYIKDYKDDTMCELYLFQMSQLYANSKECDSALYCLDRIIKEYPKGNKVGAAYFFKGVYLKDVCLNNEASVKAFKTYIEKFPNSKQVSTAQRMIEMDTMKNPVNILKNNE